MNATTVVAVVLALVVGYLGYQYLFGDQPTGDVSQFTGGSSGPASRDIVETMASNAKTAVVFYGSQTGTAEDLATKLAKELHARFGLGAMTADLDDYDLENLDQVPEDNIVIFLMASYGEGEPTDNAVQFMTMIMDSSAEFSTGTDRLESLHYAVFGLGNSTYEMFNKVGRSLNERLEKLGAKAIGRYGEGDDGKDSIEEDFMSWRDDLLSQLQRDRGLTEHEAGYEPSLEVIEVSIPSSDGSVYLGEPNERHLSGETGGPWTPSNPRLSEIKTVRELFHEKNRSCIHMEFDTAGLRYTTGDHLAFWPQNADEEVNRFIEALGLNEKRHSTIDIRTLDNTATLRIPHPTTYDTVVRHYLEINGPVSRQVLASFAPFAPSAEAKAEARLLAGDKELFHSRVVAHSFNLGRLLLKLSGGKAWIDVPFSLVLEVVPHLQARYYSISSSSAETPDTISVTAVVERMTPPGSDHEVRGVATNNILALAASSDASQTYGITPLTYDLQGPRGRWAENEVLRAPVHVRHSAFKLPAKAAKPIIMVGPGTGVAPFRGFIHERAAQAAKGEEVGPALLFFGSRNKETDFLYADEWPQYSSFLEVITAFSRETSSKVYVQKRLLENAKRVNALLEEGAYFYVCGDASRMARDVNQTLIQIIAQERGLDTAGAERIVRKLRSRNMYQEDVW